MKNIIGNKYGKLTVISEHSKTRNGHKRYTCICDCGNNCNVLGTHLIQGNTKSCSCDRPIGKTHKQWTGFEEISGDFWNQLQRNANGSKGRRQLVFNLEKEDLWKLYLKQDKKCALSKLEIYFPKRNKDISATASLDRIDSSKGYTLDNVQWVHKDINRMKSVFDNDYFIKMCTFVAGGKCEV